MTVRGLSRGRSIAFRIGCESTQGSDCMYRLALVPQIGMRAGHKREKYIPVIEGLG